MPKTSQLVALLFSIESFTRYICTMIMTLPEIISAFLLSGIKLLFTPMGFAIDAVITGIPLWEIAVVCAAGGAFGSIIFFFVGRGLDKAGAKKPRKEGKKIFTKQNRKIVRIKHKFGLYGMSLTIGIISVPIGAILVGKYFNTDKKAIPALILSSVVWSFAITYITAFIVQTIMPLFN